MEMDRGGVFYGRADGSGAQVIARPVLTPNGIALSPDGRTLYFAETARAALGLRPHRPGQARHEPGRRRMAAGWWRGVPRGHYQRFESMAVDAFATPASRR